jgi:hypothetical protein
MSLEKRQPQVSLEQDQKRGAAAATPASTPPDN